MQSCPKNVDTGALIGNGKGAPVVSGPGLSLPPSAMVGPPSPARGLAGLAPPHGANAWDTDRVQINTHRNLNQNQPPSVPPSHNLVGGHSRLQNQDCRSKVRVLLFLHLIDILMSVSDYFDFLADSEARRVDRKVRVRLSHACRYIDVSIAFDISLAKYARHKYFCK